MAVNKSLDSPKVFFVEQEALIRSIAGTPTAVTGIIGIFQWGPVRTPVQVFALAEARRIFGSYNLSGHAYEAVEGFFKNGGKVLWISRIVHFTDITDNTTDEGVVATVSIDDTAGVPIPTLQVDGKFKGTRGNNISITIQAASNGEVNFFDLLVLEGGIRKEIWPNISMLDTDPRYVETIINDADAGSDLITVTDLDSATAPPADQPDPAGSPYALAGGDDGLTGIADADWSGDSGAETGFHAYNAVLDLRILSSPDKQTAAAQQAQVDYMDVDRGGIGVAITDMPESQTAAQARTYQVTTASLFQRSEYGFSVWPWGKVSNPSETVYGKVDTITVPPSGYIAGLMAATDASEPGGVYKTPSGVERGIVRGFVGLETDEVNRETIRDLIYPVGINPIAKLPNRPIFLHGSRMSKTDGNWPFINQRRGVIFIEFSIQEALLFVMHTNNNAQLRGQVERSIELFLGRQFDFGAFAGTTKSDAFTVDADIAGEGINNAAVQKSGIMFVDVGVAMVTPAQFVILRISPDERKILEALAA